MRLEPMKVLSEQEIRSIHAATLDILDGCTTGSFASSPPTISSRCTTRRERSLRRSACG
jgi:hypothetical protein